MSETIETETVTKPPVEPEKPRMEPARPKIRDTEDAILELRKENEKLRKTLEEQAGLKAEELSNQKLEALRSETEEKATARAEKLLEKRLAEIDAAAKSRLVKSELRSYAMRAGVVDFDDLYDVLKRTTLKDVTFDEDGEVANASEIISDIKQKKVHLFATIHTSSTERAPTGRTDTGVEKPALTMNDAEFEKSLRKLIGA